MANGRAPIASPPSTASMRTVGQPGATGLGGAGNDAGAEGAPDRRAAVQPAATLPRLLRRKIHKPQQALSQTALRVTQDQQDALAVSDRIRVWFRAGIAQDGSPRPLHEEPRGRRIAGFTGAANLVPMEIDRLDGTLAM